MQFHVNGERYVGFQIAYTAAGGRQRRRFNNYAEALREAQKVVEQKAQGALGAAALTAAQRVDLESALAALAEHEGVGNATVNRLSQIVRDYVMPPRSCQRMDSCR